MTAKRRKSRAEARPRTSEDARKNLERQQNAIAASREKQAQRNHAAEVAKTAPMESPMVELLRAARGGDPDAIDRADALYGSSWRVKRLEVA